MALSGIEGFCEQRGEDDPSHSLQGCEDLNVMLLPLPRLGLLGRDEAGGQAIEPVMRFLGEVVVCDVEGVSYFDRLLSALRLLRKAGDSSLSRGTALM